MESERNQWVKVYLVGMISRTRWWIGYGKGKKEWKRHPEKVWAGITEWTTQ